MKTPYKDKCNDTYHCSCGHVVRVGQSRCLKCGEALEWKPILKDDYVCYLMGKYCYGGETR